MLQKQSDSEIDLREDNPDTMYETFIATVPILKTNNISISPSTTFIASLCSSQNPNTISEGNFKSVELESDLCASDSGYQMEWDQSLVTDD